MFSTLNVTSTHSGSYITVLLFVLLFVLFFVLLFVLFVVLLFVVFVVVLFIVLLLFSLFVLLEEFVAFDEAELVISVIFLNGLVFSV